MAPSENADPFTGTGARTEELRHLPLGSCVLFRHCQKDQMLNKIKEFSATAGAGLELSEAHVGAIASVLEAGVGGNAFPMDRIEAFMSAIKVCSQWDRDCLFPVFDALRVGMLSTDAGQAIDKLVAFCSLFDLLVQAVAPPRNVPVELTALRMVANACTASPAFVQSLFEPVILPLAECARSKSKHVRMAWATVLLNCAVLSRNGQAEVDDVLLLSLSFQAASDLLGALDTDACFRALGAMGTLMAKGSGLVAMASDLGAAELVSRGKQMGGKISEVAKDIELITARAA